MKIFRNICELCGHSFDSQYGFYKHLKEHYEPEFVSIGYPVQGLPVQGGGGMPEEDSEYAKEDENDGFVNDNEQFEEIFANNINKSPDMIEHLEIFIKNQESRTESIEGIMMIGDPRAHSPHTLPEFVGNMEVMRSPQQQQQQQVAHIMPCTAPQIPEIQYESHQSQQPMTNDKMSTIPVTTTTLPMEHQEIMPAVEDVEEEEEEHFPGISSLPPSSPSPPPPPTPPTETIPIKIAPSRNKIPKPKTRRYPCPDCERSFESSTALKYHVTSHASRTIRCEYCDKMFLTKSTLAIHLRIHLEERPYDCSQCELRFRQKTDLNYHISSKHTPADDYRFQCEFCDKKFARKYSLSLHTKLHTGEKNYLCEVCNKSFRAGSYLQVHMRSHTGEKPYECGLCAKRFSVKADLRRHLSQVHREGGGGGGGEGASVAGGAATAPKKRKKTR